MNSKAMLPAPTAMKVVLLALLVAALLGMLGWFTPAGAQGARAAQGASRAHAERDAVDLRQGMTLEEVQQLLGKPWRTALASNGAGGAPSQGILRWSYSWFGSASASSMERTLQVEFTAKTADQWSVSGWSWSIY